MTKAKTYEQTKYLSEVIPIHLRVGVFLVKSTIKVFGIKPIEWFLKESFLGTVAKLSHLSKKQPPTTVITYLINILEPNPNFLKPYQYWYLMRIVLSLVQDRQLSGDLTALFWLYTLEKMINTAKTPQGYDCAYVYIGISLWCFQNGDMDKCISYAKISVLADPTWSYAEYILGWYGFFDQRVDTIHHMTKAVEHDWDIFHRIKRDSVCQQHPHIIKAIQNKLVIPKQHQ